MIQFFYNCLIWDFKKRKKHSKRIALEKIVWISVSIQDRRNSQNTTVEIRNLVNLLWKKSLVVVNYFCIIIR
ncbi:MAG: hypothetical protein DRP58_08315 [Spirochaetes bacterium]|nr:MAG: hypothetical protein DRP58_08315 [Spirochaetota bacterium]